MKNLNHSILLILILIIWSCSNSSIYFEDSYCIENISIIDPNNGFSENMTLVIKDDKIFLLSKTNDLNLSKKNKIYNGSNKFIIPGLWDSHVHFAYEKGLAPSMLDLFLAHGITSVRDTGGDIDFINKFKLISKNNPYTSPRVMIAGPLIDGKYNVYDGSSQSYPPMSIMTETLIDLSQKVNELIDKDVDFLKAYEMLTLDQFERLASLAKENKLKLTGHVPLSMDLITASNLGLNSLEHLRNFELTVAKNSKELLKTRKYLLKNPKGLSGGALRSSIHKLQRMEAIKNIDSLKLIETINILAKNDTWQVPTLYLYRNFAFKLFGYEKWKNSFYMLPIEIRDKWNKIINEMDDDLSGSSQDYSNWQMGVVNLMNKNGINFMAGTDTPIYFLTPGLSLHKEIQILVKSGLSNIEALKSSTYNPSKYFGLQHKLGSIKEGQIADLVILSENPLKNIENTKSIEVVIKNGNYLNRKYLDSLLKRNSN